jgi:hypothetical protein
MNPIKSFRNDLDLTQQKLALFLNVSRGVVAMAEGSHPLPTMARVRLTQVGRLLDSLPLTPPDECAATKKALLNYAAECRAEAGKKQAKLEGLQTSYAKAVRLHSLSTFLLENAEELQLTPQEIRITNLWKKDAWLTIDDCGMAVQQLLERKVLDLEAAAAKAVEQAAGLSC